MNAVVPIYDELPGHYADRLGVEYTSLVTQQHKKVNGQFFTPIEIASFMGSLPESDGAFVRILDPGCGTAILSCALVEHLTNSNKGLKSIELVCYETDLELIPYTKKALHYLTEWAEKKGVRIKVTLHEEDFILHNAKCFEGTGDLFSQPIEEFDIVISNPPYFKLSKEDKRAIAGKIVINGHPNIYAIFMALSARMLKKNGELIYITPRSYAAGEYFKIFREYFFKLIDLDRVHLFVSRKDTFSRDKVLQETIIIKGTKRSQPTPHVTISSSSGLRDLIDSEIKIFPQKDILDVHSTEKILYLPTSDIDESVQEVFKNWKGNLAKYNIRISTGPVVAFRAWDHISENIETGTEKAMPLFWLHNVKQMALEWPIIKPNKGQYIRLNQKSLSLLIPNKNYILLRRFSSKDDKNRLIAAPYFCNFINADYIGVENKVNYIYRYKGHLDRNEIVGLCSLLNSSLFDTYFRIFNGNVNVSATELREIPLPDLDIIREIGDTIILSNDFSVIKANRVINEYFEPAYTINE